MDNISRISIVVFLLCSVFLCSTVANVLEGLSCTGCGIVQLGEPRKIACRYPDGISTLSSEEVTVSLDMYIGDLSADNDKIVDVLEDCKWSKINTGECNRLIMPGYNITKQNDQEFAITITNVTVERLGTYIIQFAPEPSFVSKPCSVRTNDTANPYQTTTIFTTNWPITSTDDSSDTATSSTAPIVGSFGGIALLLLVIAISVYFYRKRQRGGDNGAGPQVAEELCGMHGNGERGRVDNVDNQDKADEEARNLLASRRGGDNGAGPQGNAVGEAVQLLAMHGDGEGGGDDHDGQLGEAVGGSGHLNAGDGDGEQGAAGTGDSLVKVPEEVKRINEITSMSNRTTDCD